jgi:two-component system sensor histidine kinase/response regulator
LARERDLLHLIAETSPVGIAEFISYIMRFSDHGCGMTREQIAQIGAGMQFERRLYEQQGAGLELVAAKRLTELHGGELTIQSGPGLATTLQVALALGEHTQE